MADQERPYFQDFYHNFHDFLQLLVCDFNVCVLHRIKKTHMSMQ